ncbi:D-alanyl-D-alanine carboxypeptidase/D-alanyl-D-alanine endopeptidase [Nocardioides marmoraquaticus]
MVGDERHTGVRRRRRWRSWLVEALVLALLAVAVVSYRFDLGERWLGWGPVDPTLEPAAVLPPVGLRLPAPRPAPAVAEPSRAVALDPAAVAAAVRPELRGRVLGPHFSVLVTDLRTGEEVFSAGAPEVIPASTTKLLTTVAALEVLTPTARFATTVRWQPEQRRLVLVGGGDPFLARSPAAAEGLYPERADLTTLARRTVDALRERDVDLRGVRLAFDDSLFSGPRVNPTWPDMYLDDVTSGISSLWVDQAADGDGFGFAPDPAAQAAGVFAGLLREAGAGVRGEPRRVDLPGDPAGTTTGTASASAEGREPLAQVRSATVGEIAEQVLAVSDNQGADVLAHHVGLAERGEGSFAGGAAATLDVVRRLGVPVDGARLLDGSGLSRDNLLPARTLADVVRLAAGPGHPELRQVVTGLPIAGFSGSLAARFAEAPAQALGRVRAKTGTLMSVHGLAGVVDSPDGARLAFVAVADRVRPERDLGARLRIDDIAAALGACRCGVGS